jgi:hypothetical protein
MTQTQKRNYLKMIGYFPSSYKKKESIFFRCTALPSHLRAEKLTNTEGCSLRGGMTAVMTH